MSPSDEALIAREDNAHLAFVGGIELDGQGPSVRCNDVTRPASVVADAERRRLVDLQAVKE